MCLYVCVCVCVFVHVCVCVFDLFILYLQLLLVGRGAGATMNFPLFEAADREIDIIGVFRYKNMYVHAYS